MSVLTDSNHEIQAQSYVGFDTITKQIEHKLLKRGFRLNVMVVGQTGLGKSTMVNTLFASHLIDSKGRLDVDGPIPQTTAIEETQHTIVENGVKLKLNIIDTPGYGDLLNNDGCWEPITRYIKDQYSGYLRKELTAQRDRHIADTRVHCCLFFINPTGHGLKPVSLNLECSANAVLQLSTCAGCQFGTPFQLDITVLRKLSEVVNVVPVIAKADSLTLEERELFKERNDPTHAPWYPLTDSRHHSLWQIRAELQQHAIKLYPFDTEELDAEEIQLNERIRDMIPFAVVGSEKTVVIDGKAVRGRKTRWATINVEDERHCEFVYLRNFLTRTHLQDLIETTSLTHYETFRAKQLTALKESSAKQQQQHQQATAL
ncbi:hypothetical protein QFC22_004135 [Naganishia vaughanmartiniae]|uniref:Uncharacterized protein n=1 Tax=Naganishia vaughanmartiniae TaxID=1424756 RepID=A0ACC2X387_9TREE|nr:hypothetical protein QFC22_004135 [Naganishia vaughanmartiniae]